MRRAERQTTLQEAVKILQEGSYGVLATVGSDNQPYGIPLNYAYADNNLYLHCALEGQKLNNILHNNRVSFTVISKADPIRFSTDYESVIAFGKADIIHEPIEKLYGFRELVKKYNPELMVEGEQCYSNRKDNLLMIKISLDKITGKRRPRT